MKYQEFSTRLSTILVFALPMFILISCDKADDLFLSDSEKLMKDLKGTYKLVSVRHEELSSNNGGVDWNLAVDTTFNASGILDMSTIDKADYTGSLSIKYAGFDETHSIYGSASGFDSYDNLWIITNGEDISSMLLFNPPASYIEGWLDEQDDDHILLRISETSWDYSSHKNRFFLFEKD